MDSLPDKNVLVLSSLATYTFLTVPQLMKLGIAGHRENAYKVMRRFKGYRKPMVAKQEVAFDPKRGRFPPVHYLTKYGAATLAEIERVDPETIYYPSRIRSAHNDYLHRTHTIDCHIAFHQWVEKNNFEPLFFDTYFSKHSGTTTTSSEHRLRAKTRVLLNGSPFVPDAVYGYKDEKGAQHISVFEMYNGHDTGRVTTQLRKHLRALELGLFSDKYNYEFGTKVVFVFVLQNALNAFVSTVKNDIEYDNFEHYFSYMTLEQFLL